MKLLGLLSLCVAVTHALKIQPVRNLGPRIVNGKTAKDGEFPWQVAIMGVNSLERFLCGGAIISEEWILTAAHCVSGGISAKIYGGSASLISKNRTTNSAAQFIHHENYVADTLRNDIGLIRLQTPLEFNDNVKAISLSDEPLEGNVTVTISGWGDISDEDSTLHDILNYIEVTTMTNTACTAYYGDFIDDNIVCTDSGSFSTIHQPCVGDSGGPVVINRDTNPVHVATFSFVNGIGCDIPYPAGYTRTASYRQWIKEKTGV